MPIQNPPILRLSRIIIDVDKDWGGMEIKNVSLVGFKQEIIPAEPKGVALVIKDVTGTIDRIVLFEDGSIVSGKVEVRI